MTAPNFSTHPELRWRVHAELEALMRGMRGAYAAVVANALVESYRRMDEGVGRPVAE